MFSSPSRTYSHPLAHFFPDRLRVVEEQAILIDVVDLGARADLDFAARRFELRRA